MGIPGPVAGVVRPSCPDQVVKRQPLLAFRSLAAMDCTDGLYLGLRVIRSLERILVRQALLDRCSDLGH